MKYRICMFASIFFACLSWIIRVNPLIPHTTIMDMGLELIYCFTWTLYSIFFFFCIKKTFEAARTSKELELLKKQQVIQKQQESSLSLLHKKALSSQEESIRQLNYIQKCLREKNYEEACSFTENISKQFEETRFRPVCDDSLISSILLGKKEYARERGIQVEYSLLFPRELENLHTDLSGLFFNLLDNGIEACLLSGSKQPFIQLQVKYHLGFLHITMKNSKDPNTVFTHKTTKNDYLEHGFGLSIIEDIVTKYDGTYEWIDKKDTFESFLMLRYC